MQGIAKQVIYSFNGYEWKVFENTVVPFHLYTDGGIQSLVLWEATFRSHQNLKSVHIQFLSTP